MISFANDRLSVHFKRFDLPSYEVFLKCKRLPESQVEFLPEDESYRVTAPARFAPMLGIDVPPAVAQDLPISDFLFDDQREIVTTALASKRFAVWSDCGLGKTLIILEFARQVMRRTGKRFLIFTVNEVVKQFVEECQRFYGDTLPIHRIESRAKMREWLPDLPRTADTLPKPGYGIDGLPNLGITNYEKMNPESIEDQVVSEMMQLGGVGLDESSRLKAGGGKQKWALIKSCKGIEYKLSCTATPAPNDIMEYASQASFLEKMRSESEIIWTYFIRDSKTHRWTVKPHARAAFFEFMAGWSIYVRDPKRYGWRIGMPEVPEPIVQTYQIEPTAAQMDIIRLETRDDLTGQQSLVLDRELNAIQRMKLSQVAKGFRYHKGGTGKYDLIDSRKPAFVADLIKSEIKAGHQVLVWTVFDAESEILLKHLVKAFKGERLTGKTKDADRVEILERFRRGESPCLISLASMLGFGMNFQNCSSMIFSGWSDSFEMYYQAVRRAYRFGQKKRVRVHLPFIEDLEGDQLQNVFRKESEHNRAISEMEDNYIRAFRAIRGAA